MKYFNQILIICLVLGMAVVGFTAETETPAAEPSAAGKAVELKLVKFDVSPPLRDVKVKPKSTKSVKIFRDPTTFPDVEELPEDWNGKVGTRFSPHVHQKSPGSRATIPTPSANVEGLGRGLQDFPTNVGVPPDTTGGVGLDYYIQWVNTWFAFFEKDGSIVDLDGDDWRDGNTLWDGFGGRCEFSNEGDPVALYDQLAGRWVMTQFGLGATSNGPHYQCVAVSTTGDPLGTWNRYEYQWPNSYLNDYPKLSVWTDGYYLTVNEFQCSGPWSNYNCTGVGGAVAVFDRENLIQGTTPRPAQYFDLTYTNILPVDLDGDTEPPAGSPGYFVNVKGGVSHYVRIWETFIDWDNSANSTCGDASNNPSSIVNVTAFNNTNGIEQPNTTEVLDAMSPRAMFRAPYRNFGDHESLLLTHTVGNPGGKRWYEIRDPGGTPVLYQEGTYNPDAEERWMGGIAMDNAGNIALGYSVSGSATSPSVRVTGRLADDPLGTMAFSELEVATGSGRQNPVSGRNRWGDYSTMSIDPADDCTFWYTQEYVTGIGAFIWRTRIAAFKFDECSAPDGSIFSDGFESSDTSAWSTTAP